MSWWNFSAAAAATAHEPDEHAHPVECAGVMDPVLALLARLARTEAAVTLISLSNSASTIAEFVRVQGSRVTLRIRDPEVSTMRVFGPLSCALLVFVDGKNANIVMGSVIREPTKVNGCWLVLLEMGQKLLPCPQVRNTIEKLKHHRRANIELGGTRKKETISLNEEKVYSINIFVICNKILIIYISTIFNFSSIINIISTNRKI